MKKEKQKELEEIIKRIIKHNIDCIRIFDPLWSRTNPNGVMPVDEWDKLIKLYENKRMH